MTDSQGAAIKVLRRRAATWRWFRWVLLTAGIAISAGATYYSIEVAHNLADLSTGAKESPGVVVLLSSMNASTLAELRILAWIGPVFVAWAVGNWRGDPAVTVLLDLVDRSSERVSTVA
jgi:hypothetical protein